MKKVLVVLPIAISAVLLSCQKEVDFDNGSGASGGGGGGGTTGNKLVRTVSKNGSDSAVTTYTYNANKKLINQKITGMMQGIDVSNEFRYYRNASGIITHYTQINPNLILVGIDSVVTKVHYNTGASRYTSSVTELSLLGFSVKDSTVLVYDGTGKVIRSDVYQSIPLLGGYDLSVKINYAYTGANVTQLDMVSHDPVSGTDDPISNVKYTYDTKTSALNVSEMFTSLAEAFVINHGDWISANNATKVEIIDVTDPANNQSSTVTYTYNSNNRPVTGVNTRMPGGIVDNLSFYYQ